MKTVYQNQGDETYEVVTPHPVSRDLCRVRPKLSKLGNFSGRKVGQFGQREMERSDEPL